MGAAAAALVVCVLCRMAPAEPAPVILRTLETERLEENGPALLDLNLATAEELEALPGIGPTLARRMIDWRAENGPFRSREDVLAVRGIGEATYEKIAPYITY